MHDGDHGEVEMHDGFASLSNEPMSELEVRRLFDSRLHYWWAGLDDRSLFGYHFCCGCTGQWWRFPWVKLTLRQEMFHNGQRFIPGAEICIAGLVLQISRELDWLIPDPNKCSDSRQEHAS